MCVMTSYSIPEHSSRTFLFQTLCEHSGGLVGTGGPLNWLWGVRQSVYSIHSNHTPAVKFLSIFQISSAASRVHAFQFSLHVCCYFHCQRCGGYCFLLLLLLLLFLLLMLVVVLCFVVVGGGAAIVPCCCCCCRCCCCCCCCCSCC